MTDGELEKTGERESRKGGRAGAAVALKVAIAKAATKRAKQERCSRHSC